MNCEQWQMLLGRYHDCELTRSERNAMEIHLAACTSCAADLGALAELSEAVCASEQPDPPTDLWERIAESVPRSQRRDRITRMRRACEVAVASAIVGVAAILGWSTFHRVQRVYAPGNAVAANVVNLGPFLDDLSIDVSGRHISLQEAAQRFPVLTLAQLPDGYCLKGCCMCRCGCCDLLECKYLRGREPLLVVQCGEDNAVDYGRRHVLETRIHGKTAQIIQCDGRLAVSWQTNGSVLHLVGPGDLSELLHLMEEVDQLLHEKPHTAGRSLDSTAKAANVS
jgi:hypothetical protein